jgi:hypothetical protein
MSLTLRRTVFLDAERRPDDYEVRYAGKTVGRILRLRSDPKHGGLGIPLRQQPPLPPRLADPIFLDACLMLESAGKRSPALGRSWVLSE